MRNDVRRTYKEKYSINNIQYEYWYRYQTTRNTQKRSTLMSVRQSVRQTDRPTVLSINQCQLCHVDSDFPISHHIVTWSRHYYAAACGLATCKLPMANTLATVKFQHRLVFTVHSSDDWRWLDVNVWPVLTSWRPSRPHCSQTLIVTINMSFYRRNLVFDWRVWSNSDF